MKTLFLTCLLIGSITAYGKIWIVDSNTGSTAKDFTNLQSAHNGASAGDTLYLIGSTNNYLNPPDTFSPPILLSKRLVIIGPGYFLNENIETQSSPLSAFLRNNPYCTEEIEFLAGSEGSVMMGLIINGRIKVSTNNIIIKRNLFGDSCVGERITINGSNIFIVQNYIWGASTGTGIKVNAGFSNIVVNNNYIFNYCYGCGAGITALNAPGSSLEVSNNIFVGGINVTNSIVQNNLFTTGNNLTFNSSVVRNNIAAEGAYLPDGNGNSSNTTGFTNGFIGSGSTDGKWQLSASSAFKGAGFNGVDCGIFGGSEPYVLSGIPPIPTIYSLTAPTVGEKNTGLPIQIKVKSNN